MTGEEFNKIAKELEAIAELKKIKAEAHDVLTDLMNDRLTTDAADKKLVVLNARMQALGASDEKPEDAPKNKDAGPFDDGVTMGGPVVAPYFVLIKPYGVYVKEGAFFRDQGGLTEDWGASWVPIIAKSLDDAYTKARTMQSLIVSPEFSKGSVR